MKTLNEERHEAMALLQAGQTVAEVARQLQRSELWVGKWRQRFAVAGYSRLHKQSRAPQQRSHELPMVMREAVIRVRMQLEAEASQGQWLKYVGG